MSPWFLQSKSGLSVYCRGQIITVTMSYVVIFQFFRASRGTRVKDVNLFDHSWRQVNHYARHTFCSGRTLGASGKLPRNGFGTVRHCWDAA